jgi:SAM-dependent methyltransferase
MEWIPAFYDLQTRWTGAGDRPIHALDRRLAKAIGEARPQREGPLRVLELGAGDGRTAVATAEQGHAVTAVELVPTRVAHARRMAREHQDAIEGAQGALTIVEGDFYTLDLDGPFDVVAYWDGFGVGEDVDQRRLLRRVAGWMAPDGVALVDIYTPWYWAASAGLEMAFGSARRRYGFDAEGVRMLDTWWPEDRPDDAVTQSLRCYGPADLRLLLDGTGLRLTGLEPGGAWDAEAGRWEDSVPLGRAMGYRARLERADGPRVAAAGLTAKD